MLLALSPTNEVEDTSAASLATKLALAEARVKQLETDKRRAERLLLLTRKLVRPGPVISGRKGPKKRLSSTPVGPKPLKASTESTMDSPDALASSPTTPGEATP